MNDGRYTIRLEYCGYTEPRFVARFCGEWIGQALTRVVATKMAQTFNAKRFA